MRAAVCRPELFTWQMSDGYKLRGRLWPPQQASPRRAFLYIHGIQSHGGWFEWSASLLAQTGQPVLLADRRGSGMNELARGDTPSAQRWLQDLDELADWIRTSFGVSHFAVVGVSWGAKLATAWTLRRPEDVCRLLLVAPGLFPAVDLDLAAKLQVVCALITKPQRSFPIPLNDPALFTDNPEGQRFIAADPLKLARVTARFLWHSRKLDRKLRRMPEGSLRSPLSILLAGRERIVRNEPTLVWAGRVSACRPQVRIFPQAAHTLEFEPDVSELEHFLRGWARGCENFG
jgi:acylglycerol lipase